MGRPLASRNLNLERLYDNPEVLYGRGDPTSDIAQRLPGSGFSGYSRKLRRIREDKRSKKGDDAESRTTMHRCQEDLCSGEQDGRYVEGDYCFLITNHYRESIE